MLNSYFHFLIFSLALTVIAGDVSQQSLLKLYEEASRRLELIKNRNLINKAIKEGGSLKEVSDNHSRNVSFVSKLGSSHGFLSDPQKKCLNDVKYTLEHLSSNWSIQMLDANGKVPSGTLLGNFLWMGKYQECIDVYMPPSRDGSQSDIHGLYCVAAWNVTVPNSFHMPLQHIPIKTGVCVPKSCGSLNMEEGIKDLIMFLHRLPFLNQYGRLLDLASLKCKVDESSLNSSLLAFCVFLCLYLSFVAAGSSLTMLEYCHCFFTKSAGFRFKRKSETVRFSSSYSTELTKCEESEVSVEYEECEDDQQYCNDLGIFSNGHQHSISHIFTYLRTLSLTSKYLKCFCVFTNCGNILDTRKSKKNFPCIHGIRFLSMAWIILGHTYIHNTNVIGNYVDFLHGIDNLPFQVIVQGTFSVDTFFLISGFLLAYIYLDEADKRNGNMNWLGIILHRFLRITPVYMLLIAFDTLIFKYTGHGPFWGEELDDATCKQYWWWNLLYINNFLPLESMCDTWTWYLANDMQFFIMGTLLLYILWRWRKVGLFLCCSLVISSWIVTWCISYSYDLIPLFWGISKATDYEEYKEKLYLVWNVLYTKPYCRIGPYIFGILLACIMYNKRNDKTRINWRMKVLGWSAASFCCLSVIYGVYYMQPNPYLFSTYNALSRSTFSLGVAWVIYCCLSRNGDLVNRILSFDLWVPLSRLTYCAYLFHPLVMSWYFEAQKVPLYFTHMNMVMLYFAFLVVSYTLALMVSLLFEAPIINLEKTFRKNHT